jgi:hypothetical protein
MRNFQTPSPAKSRLYDANIENLKTALEYLTHLKNKGRLKDNEFSALITQVCANFVENEIAAIFNKVLGKTLNELFGEYEHGR